MDGAAKVHCQEHSKFGSFRIFVSYEKVRETINSDNIMSASCWIIPYYQGAGLILSVSAIITIVFN